MKKAIFLDRDGTINVEKNYLFKIEDFVFENFVFEALKYLMDKGFLLIIVTNQAGIARGYYTVADFLKLDTYMKKKLAEKGIKIAETFFCPHHLDGKMEEYAIDCNCRKPKTQMVEKAALKYNLDLKNSYMIGDKASDINLGKNCNLKTILVGTGYGKQTKQENSCNYDFYIENLGEIKKIIN